MYFKSDIEPSMVSRSGACGTTAPARCCSDASRLCRDPWLAAPARVKSVWRRCMPCWDGQRRCGGAGCAVRREQDIGAPPQQCGDAPHGRRRRHPRCRVSVPIRKVAPRANSGCRHKTLKNKAFSDYPGTPPGGPGVAVSQRCDMSSAVHSGEGGKRRAKPRKVPARVPGGPCNTRSWRRRWRSWHRLCARGVWFGWVPDLNLQPSFLARAPAGG
ncbi:hypothetical protein CMPELA_19220 [Cupriavidus necator]